MTKTVLTVAGSDSSGGAGIQADLGVFSALTLHGASAVTAVTAQTTTAVSAWAAVAAGLVREQLRCVLDDMTIVAAKTGMLANGEIAGIVADELSRGLSAPLVCDPVLISSSGSFLYESGDLDVLLTKLFPLATILTPNADEAAALTGREVRTPADAEEAGKHLLETGAGAVLVTGGHFQERRGTDVLVTRRGARELPGEWIDTEHTHGTGCVLSAAIAGYLAEGQALPDAVTRAKVFVTNAIRSGRRLGRGRGAVDPSGSAR